MRPWVRCTDVTHHSTLLLRTINSITLKYIVSSGKSRGPVISNCCSTCVAQIAENNGLNNHYFTFHWQNYDHQDANKLTETTKRKFNTRIKKNASNWTQSLALKCIFHFNVLDSSQWHAFNNRPDIWVLFATP